MVLRREHHDRHPLVDERDRPVLHFAGRVAFGVDVGDLLQLQRAFERDGVVDAAAQVEEVGRAVEPAGDLLDLRRELQRLLEQLRQLQQRVDVRLRRLGGQHAARLAQTQPQQIQRDELRREGFGRRHADFRSGVRVDRAVGFAGRHAADHVADGDAGRALALRFAQRGERVGGLARLRDDDRQRVGRDDGIPVAVFGSVIDLDRHLRELLDEIFPDQPRVPRRAARQDRDPLDGAQLRFGDLHLLEEHAAGVLRHAAEDRLARGRRLLEDLLEHEVLVAGLLGHDRIPQDALRRFGDRPAEEIGERHARGGDDRHLLVAEEDDVARVAQNRGNVRRDEEFAVAQADDDRRPVPDGDDFFGIVGRDEHQREQAAHQQERPAHGVLEAVVFHLALDQVRDDFGIGLGDERVALPLKLLLQIEIVLDDAVVNDDDLARAVAVRVRVLFGGPAVRRPPRMADAVVAGDRVQAVMTSSSRDSLPALRRKSMIAVVHHGHARRVVAAVFEPPQSVDEDRDDFLRSDVADNPAHFLLRSLGPHPQLALRPRARA